MTENLHDRARKTRKPRSPQKKPLFRLRVPSSIYPAVVLAALIGVCLTSRQLLRPGSPGNVPSPQSQVSSPVQLLTRPATYATPPGEDRSPASLSRDNDDTSSLSYPSGGGYYSGAPVRMIETPRDRDGNFKRIRTIQTSFKYPLLRIVERFGPGPGQAGDRLLSETAMVADHVLVQVPDGVSRSQLSRVAARYGGQIRRALLPANVDAEPTLFLVAFDGTDPLALDRMLKALRAEGEIVRSAGPDFIARPY
jgi:hypothetical protein